MDADGPGRIRSPGTEEETIARKRSRRVSFADTTAVHVFDRDEDFETPPEELSASAPESASPSPSPRRSSAKAEDGEDTSDADSPAPPIIFRPDIDSSSPGSAAGSVVSADDENFFGPVSTSFIQTGRPSDAGMSDAGMSEDGNHDITLDSRTFSMQFLKAAIPDDCTANSVGSLRTPTTVSKGQLEELNVSDPGRKYSSGRDASTDMSMLTGSLRTPTMASKGHLEELSVSEPARKSYSGRDALTDMSMLTGDPKTYNYGKLSPLLKDIMQKIEQGQQTNSPIAGISDVNADQSLVFISTELERREENSCIGNDPVSTSSDPIEEDNAMITDVLEKSQENGNHDQVAVDLGVNNTVESHAKLSPRCNSVTSNLDMQPRHPFHESLSKHQPCNSICATRASSMSKLELECYSLDQPLSRDELPKTHNITNAPQLSTADPVIWQKEAEQPHQQNEVMDAETILHTPRTAVQQLEVPEDSILSLHSHRQELFSATPISNCKVSCPEASSLSVEFVKQDQRISALENLLKLRPQESLAAFQLPLVEGKDLCLQASGISRSAEDQATCDSVRRWWLKKTGESFIPGAPLGQGSNGSTDVQPTSCDGLTLDSQLSRECNSYLDLDGGGRNRSATDNGHAVHEWPEETSKAAISAKNSRKELTSASEPSVLLKVFKEKESGDNDSAQSVNFDPNKVVCTISDVTEHVLAPSISKLNLQQLDTQGDKLDNFQMARKYRRLSAAVRVIDCCGDRQKRLAEILSLHERLLYEGAKLQVNNAKLAELRIKSQQYQIGIQDCSFLKCKTLGAAQMNNSSLHDTSLICLSNGEEPLAVLSKKRLEYNIIQQKVESLRSSLEYFRNNKVDISPRSIMKSAEEQSDIRNQCHIVQQQIGLSDLMDIVKRDNRHDVILNYRNLLFQRIILNIRDISSSSIFVSNSLNGTKIGQTFPDLDALVAFNYIFKAEEIVEIVSDLRLLQKKTMETSLLLGNLVDVLDEIKFAKMKLLNLTSAAFVLESPTCQLALRLFFMSFKSGKTIGFTIDMTDLNCSVYPSEPSELGIKLCQAQTTISQPTIDEIIVSIRNLQPGRTMFIRLCRMVSQLIQSLPC